MSEPRIKLGKNETAIVGYGSLLSIPSIERALLRKYDGPFIKCHIEGWHRSWDITMPNKAYYYTANDKRIYPEKIIYLNVRTQVGVLMNCVVFVVNSEELESMNDREWIYTPRFVNSTLRGIRIESGNAVLYVGSEEHILHQAAGPNKAAIRASYLETVEKAMVSMTPLFREEYRKTTDLPPKELVIKDSLDPMRPNPWTMAGKKYLPD